MVFGCISKNFPKNIFWCLEKKKENINPEKHKPQPRKKSSTTTLNSVRRPRSEIAIDGAIAISPSSRDCAVDRDLGSRSTARSSDGVQCRRWWFFPGLWLLFFWICVFLLLFHTPENIFRKIFWNATKYHGNIFLFRKLAFPENMYFPENVLQQLNTA